MKTRFLLAGAARSSSALLCLLVAIGFVFSASGQVDNFNSVKTKANPQVNKVQQIYTSQIGVREKGTNSGPDVEKYLRYVNLPKGNPWCAAFVCWVYGQAGVGNPRSGWSPSMFPASSVIWDRAESGKLKPESYRVESGWADKRALYPYSLARARRSFSEGGTGNRQPATPRSGDIFALFFPEKNRIAHTGFIDQWDGTWLITVEGNTNVAGSREGDGVYRKRRLVRTVYMVARYIH